MVRQKKTELMQQKISEKRLEAKRDEHGGIAAINSDAANAKMRRTTVKRAVVLEEADGRSPSCVNEEDFAYDSQDPSGLRKMMTLKEGHGTTVKRGRATLM